MKAKLIFVSILIVLCGKAFAQDIIHIIDSPRPIKTKVLEITDDYIRYKTFDNLDGPEYRISVNRVARIVFENGTEKSFTPATILAPVPYTYKYYGPLGHLEYHRGHYYDSWGRVYSEQLRDYLGVSIYGSDYLKARSQYSWGCYLSGTGATLLLFSVIGGAANAYGNAWAMRHGLDSGGGGAFFVSTVVVGAAGLGVGIPLWIKGNKKLNAIADDYNQRHGHQNYGYNPNLKIGPLYNGLGVALTF